ncbi:MAG: 50S ribosomal protein L22 [Acidimicrobiia bacterium]|nr:50S ribosomal protein L22 [Acidimicrobiia bacterium]
MTGPKLNERSYVAGERSGTKASAKYVRTSASKAREVLDLVRGLDVMSADEVLQFTDRHVARDVRKVLASAVANAIHNDSQDVDELFVIACFADEGPTLRRFRPRARGRATRINKRTCHITVIVARMSDERIEIAQAREERAGSDGRGRPQSSAASRRARVERSRRKAADDEGGGDDADNAAGEASAGDEPGDPADQTGSVSTGAEAGSIQQGEWAGSAEPPDDGEPPEGHPIKGNAGSMLYHEPDSRYYRATKAEVWFDTVESAEAAGFTAPGAAKAEDASEADTEEKTEAADDAATAEGSASDEAGPEADQDDNDETN